jgi:uncharacterized membrane protein
MNRAPTGIDAEGGSGKGNSTNRLEAFSDGVFAIAITLLILEFRVPTLAVSGATNARLTGELIALWPSLLAFTMSFFVILVMWVNHHGLIRLARGVDYPLFFANGLVLLMVTFVPFPTAVLARYLATDACRASAAFYCGTFFVVSLAWDALFLSLARNRRLVRPDVSDAALARIRRAYTLGPLVYAGSTLAALGSASVGLAICASLWVLWTHLCYRPE